MNKNEIIEGIVLKLCLIYNAEYSDYLGVVWCEFLVELTAEEIKQGYDRIKEEYTANKMLTPQQFKEYATTAKPNDGFKTLEDEALDQWHKLVGLAKRTGSYRSLYFENDAVAQWVRNFGGWPEFCLVEEDQQKWVKKDFVAEYAILRRSKNKFDPLVLGRNDRGNYKLIAEGKSKPDIKFIGEFTFQEKQKALAGPKSKKHLRLVG
ncbi:MAG: hypothetical protein HQM14_18765 [SAR324 cluster bacterium]|nr:hypothetical protein [SAR324 cluster bacterium]